jgi:hypothetical protein
MNDWSHDMRTDVRRMCYIVQYMPTCFLCYLIDGGWGVSLDDQGAAILRREIDERVTFVAFCRILPYLRLYRNHVDYMFGLHMTLCGQPFIVPVPPIWRYDMSKRSIVLKDVNDVLIFVLFGQWIAPTLAANDMAIICASSDCSSMSVA